MRTLLKSASVVTMDEGLGDFDDADVLVEHDRIVEIRPGIDAADADVVDARGRIVMPGLINAHMHTWQTALRGFAANWTLPEYFRRMHAGLATVFRPEDIHVGTLAGALNQINCGTTTLVDWCHNNPTPAHSDAAIAALKASGIRAVFFHGSPKPDPEPGRPHFSEVPHPRGEVDRFLAGPLADREGLVTLGLAILGPHYSTLDVTLQDFRLAREYGLVASMHQGGGAAKTPEGWRKLIEAGLVGPGVNVVHGNDLQDDLLRELVDLGASFSVTPENEMVQGHGHPITGRLLRLGRRPSMGVDLESVLPGDMFNVGRVALSMQRALDNAESRSRTGLIPTTTTITTREALRWITIEGARMLGRERDIGSLAPGKKADLLVIDATDFNLSPVHDPIATVVMQAGLANIEAVMIDGVWRKRNRRLLAEEAGRCKAELERSGMRIVSEIERRGRAA